MSHQWRVPLADLQRAHAPCAQALEAAVLRVCRSGRYILGPEVAAFEREVARELDVPSACGVSSGTDALSCALAALGVAAGQAVLTTPFTFFATASAIARSGAKLRFADIEPQSFNLSVEATAAAAASEPLAAVVVVNLFGRPAEIDALRARLPREVALVEDAAQSFGAGGLGAGRASNAACYSFFPGKPLGALGDGGLVTTCEPELDTRLRALRTHGRAADGHFHWLGGNWRLDELQAAALRVKLTGHEQRRERRALLAERYRAALSELSELLLPVEVTGARHAWSVFSVRVLRGRPALQQHLLERGIECAVYYPRPLHLEPALRGLGYGRGDFPHAELAAEQVLALPLFAQMTLDEQNYVITTLAEFFGTTARLP